MRTEKQLLKEGFVWNLLQRSSVSPTVSDEFLLRDGITSTHLFINTLSLPIKIPVAEQSLFPIARQPFVESLLNQAGLEGPSTYLCNQKNK
jgi:hypothetical protein